MDATVFTLSAEGCVAAAMLASQGQAHKGAL